MLKHIADCVQARGPLCQDLHVYSYDICKVMRYFTLHGLTEGPDSLYFTASIADPGRERPSMYADLQNSDQ